MMMVWGIWSCSPEAKDEKESYTYHAPRHVDQTAVQGDENKNAMYAKKCNDPEECNPPLDRVSKDNPYGTPFNMILNTSVFAAVVDMDYDYTVSGVVDYRTGEFRQSGEHLAIPIKILKIKDVLVDRFKDKKLDGPYLYFSGECDANGLCRNYDFGDVFHMWSGVNLIVAWSRSCSLENKKRLNLLVRMAFPIEDGYLYDQQGRKYRWTDLKKLYHPVDPKKLPVKFDNLSPEALNCTNMGNPDNSDDYIDDSHNSDTDSGNIDNAPQSDQ